MTPFIRTMQDLVTRTALTTSVVCLTAALAVAQQPIAPTSPAPPAKPAVAAQPAPPARPAPGAILAPSPRPLPSRSVKLEVTVTPVAAAVAGTPRVLTVTMAEGRYAKFRRQAHAPTDQFSLDATSTIVNDRQVLVEFNLNASAIDRSNEKETPVTPLMFAGLAQEGSVLLTPGVKQRVTQLDDSGGRPNLHVEMLVEIVK